MAPRLSGENRLDKVKVWEEIVARRWGVDGFEDVTEGTTWVVTPAGGGGGRRSLLLPLKGRNMAKFLC